MGIQELLWKTLRNKRMKMAVLLVFLVCLLGCRIDRPRYIIDPEALYYDLDQKVYETRKMNCPTGIQHVVEESERIFIEIYGDEIVNERPWRVTETADFYLVCGSLPNRNMIGGVAQLKVRKQDGYIWVYFHGE